MKFEKDIAAKLIEGFKPLRANNKEFIMKIGDWIEELEEGKATLETDMDLKIFHECILNAEMGLYDKYLILKLWKD